MTAQEIFDRVLAHLRMQRVPALEAGQTCSYRTEDGKSCAVGCLIPDESYDARMEGASIDLDGGFVHGDGHVPALRNALIEAGLMPHARLLGALQEAHDRPLRLNGLSAWERSMRGIAGAFNLTYTEAS